MYTIGICDDGRNVCGSIENMLEQYAQEKNVRLDTSVWYTGEDLMNDLASGHHLDILFLDIELVNMTGTEVGSYIRNQLDDMGMQIIYISGKASYAQQLFKTQPIDFLVKPISLRQIFEVMDIAVRIITRKKERFEFQQGKDYYYVPMGDIIYLQSEGRKVKVISQKTSFEYYGKLSEAEKQLSGDFIRIHKSFIVNKEYVFRYTYETVEMIDGTIFTISMANRKNVRDKILKEE